MAYFTAAIRQQITPVKYLWIRHPGKVHFDWVVPGLVTGVVLLLVVWSPVPVRVLDKGGVVYAVTDLIKVLVGFYIAALAAVATFQKEDMDQQTEGEPLTLKVRRKGQLKDAKLTRRQFLCYLFGYLSFLSLFLYFAGACAPFVSVIFNDSLPGWLFAAVRFLCLLLYLLFAAQLITTTLLGLHFLTDRIHR